MSEWHVTPGMAAAYAHGRLDDARAWSLEAHVEQCSACARAVSATVDGPALARVREQVLAATHEGTRGFLRLTVTPALSGTWLLAVAGAVSGVLLLDLAGATRLPLLLLVAPLLPLLGVALGCSPSVDRSAELLASTPTSALRLLLLRSGAVLAVSVPPLLVVSLVIGIGPLRWLAPSAGLVALSLALSTRVRVELAAGCAAALWAVVALGPATLSSEVPAALTGQATVVWAAATVLCLALLATQRGHLEETGLAR